MRPDVGSWPKADIPIELMAVRFGGLRDISIGERTKADLQFEPGNSYVEASNQSRRIAFFLE